MGMVPSTGVVWVCRAEASHGRHSLNEILDAERVLALNLTDEEIQPLLQYLPEGQRTVGLCTASSSLPPPLFAAL